MAYGGAGTRAGRKKGAKFVTDFFSEEEASVVAFGVDCPQPLRDASQLVEPFDFTDRRNWLEDARIYDSGEIKIDDVEKKTKEILAEKKLPLILAKEHTVTLHAMRAMPAGTKLVVFDAHADVKDEYEGSRQSHACWLRRWCELAKENCVNAVLVGVRSGDEDELEFLRASDMKFFTSEEVRSDAAAVAKWLAEFVGDSEFYLSLDMDVFDPSIAPAVKYPEPSGVSWDAFVQLVHALEEGALAGMDCTEIRPIAGSMATEFVAVKSIFKILGMFVKPASP